MCILRLRTTHSAFTYRAFTRCNRRSDRLRNRSHVCLHEATVGAIIVAVGRLNWSRRSTAPTIASLHINTPYKNALTLSCIRVTCQSVSQCRVIAGVRRTCARSRRRGDTGAAGAAWLRRLAAGRSHLVAAQPVQLAQQGELPAAAGRTALPRQRCAVPGDVVVAPA